MNGEANESVTAPEDEARAVLESRARALSDAQAGPVEGVRNPAPVEVKPPTAAPTATTTTTPVEPITRQDVLVYVGKYNGFMTENAKGFVPIQAIPANVYAALAAPVLTKYQGRFPSFELPSPWGELLLAATTVALVAPGAVALYKTVTTPETPEERAKRERAEKEAAAVEADKARADALVRDLEAAPS